MAECLVRIYRNTGYNNSNIPDSPALLNQAPYSDLPALQINQERFLSAIRVRTDWNTVRGCDYCRVSYGYDSDDTTMYYFVDYVRMVATDVAELSLTPDFFTSGGGIAGFSIEDGITERVHVSDDRYGRWNSDDPLLAPSEAMQLKSHWWKPGNSSVVAVETTLNPGITARKKQAVKYEAIEGEEEPSDRDQTVLVPLAWPNHINTKFKVPIASRATNRGTALYVTYSDIALESHPAGTQSAEMQHLASLRSLGLDQAILSQVKYPTAFISFDPATATDDQVILISLDGKNGQVSSDIKFAQFDCRNNLINYSNFTKYGIMSCAGEGAEFDPSDLYNYESTESAPKVRYIADPNPDGKPYFRYSTVNFDGSTDGFWRNCISGMPWKQVPLVFTGASGSEINKIKFQNNLDLGRYDRAHEKRSNYIDFGTKSAFAGIPSGKDPVSILTGVLGGGVGAMKSWMGEGESNLKYLQQRTNELADLEIANNVVVPTVNFPFNSDVMRDAYGNGVFCYRYIYTNNDVKRIDKLLTMYGYKVTKALEIDDFSNRRYFNFIKCANITLGAASSKRRPRWFLDGAAAQLRDGVRIWHTAPNSNYYYNNPIV